MAEMPILCSMELFYKYFCIKILFENNEILPQFECKRRSKHCVGSLFNLRNTGLKDLGLLDNF